MHQAIGGFIHQAERGMHYGGLLFLALSVALSVWHGDGDQEASGAAHLSEFWASSGFGHGGFTALSATPSPECEVPMSSLDIVYHNWARITKILRSNCKIHGILISHERIGDCGYLTCALAAAAEPRPVSLPNDI